MTQDADTAPLFVSGEFTLSSGERSTFKIDCDALSMADITTLAALIAREVGAFGTVEGVPTGGTRLAEALRPYATDGTLLIVDDVLTSGASMERQRGGRDAIGCVVFARGPRPGWIRALFTMGGRQWL